MKTSHFKSIFFARVLKLRGYNAKFRKSIKTREIRAAGYSNEKRLGSELPSLYLLSMITEEVADVK